MIVESQLHDILLLLSLSFFSSLPFFLLRLLTAAAISMALCVRRSIPMFKSSAVGMTMDLFARDRMATLEI